MESQIYPDYPATEEGQKAFLLKIRSICEETESLGFCYWTPEWVPFRGDNATNESPWENRSFFILMAKNFRL